jgi:hypothetical protein
LRSAKEIFECPIQTAIDAVKKAIELTSKKFEPTGDGI